MGQRPVLLIWHLTAYPVFYYATTLRALDKSDPGYLIHNRLQYSLIHLTFLFRVYTLVHYYEHINHREHLIMIQCTAVLLSVLYYGPSDRLYYTEGKND